MLLDISITLFLVFLNGFFVAAEFAIVKVRSSQIETAANASVKITGAAKAILNHLDAYLAATQLGVTLTSLGLGWIGEGVVSSIILRIFDGFHLELAEQTAHNIALPVAFAIITILHIVFGELAPKSLAIRFPSKTTFAVALPLRFFYIVFRPFIALLNGFANVLLKLIGIQPAHGTETHSEEELRVIIQESADSGAIREIEQNIVERVFALGDRKVSELMTHRTDLVWLDINDNLRTVRQKVKQEIHSVYPVCDGQMDNLVGVLSVKDLFPIEVTNENFQLKEHIRKAIILIETTPAFKVLEHFKEHKFHYAVVIDEYGAIKGMVSMDDVVDALLGEVSEYNHEEYQIKKREDGSWLADGQLPFFVFLNYFDLDEVKGNVGFNTLGGLLINTLKHIPVVGEKTTWREFEFEIMDMDDRRIDKILISRNIKNIH
jgi:CBS domain containing-hemolysin-like protein